MTDSPWAERQDGPWRILDRALYHAAPWPDLPAEGRFYAQRSSEDRFRGPPGMRSMRDSRIRTSEKTDKAAVQKPNFCVSVQTCS